MSLTVSASLWQASPAAASEMTDSVLGFFGVKSKAENPAEGTDKGEDAIDYRPHAPLVIPPKMDLPPPSQADSSRPADWPTDPDANARRRALVDSHRPVPGSHVETAKDGGSKGEVVTGSAEKEDGEGCIPVAGQSYCLISSPWEYITDKMGMGTKKEDRVILSGEEPPRKYLVEPPPGYQSPAATTEVVDTSKTADSAESQTHHKHKHAANSTADQ